MVIILKRFLAGKITSVAICGATTLFLSACSSGLGERILENSAYLANCTLAPAADDPAAALAALSAGGVPVSHPTDGDDDPGDSSGGE